MKEEYYADDEISHDEDLDLANNYNFHRTSLCFTTDEIPATLSRINNRRLIKITSNKLGEFVLYSLMLHVISFEVNDRNYIVNVYDDISKSYMVLELERHDTLYFQNSKEIVALRKDLKVIF